MVGWDLLVGDRSGSRALRSVGVVQSEPTRADLDAGVDVLGGRRRGAGVDGLKE